MCLIVHSGDAPIEFSRPGPSTVFLQIGKVSEGPALQVSSKVLARKFKRFASYNVEGRPIDDSFVFVDIDHCGMVLLISIAHDQEKVDMAGVTFKDLKKAAQYAHKFGYQSTPAAGRYNKHPKWLPLYLRDQLPPDSHRFLEASLHEHPNGCFKKIIDVLCTALVFHCPDEFARASRQLT